jgi:hypothetical protein
LNAFSRIRIVAVDEHPDAHRLEVIHFGAARGRPRPAKVGAPQEQIDVLGRANRRVDGRDPQRNGLATDHGKIDTRRAERRRNPLPPLGDFIQRHGVSNPRIDNRE